MNDNEIIKALECCKNLHHTECACCPLGKGKDCIEKLAGSALDLINRQNAEIENYSHNTKTMANDIRKLQKALEQQKIKHLNQQKQETTSKMNTTQQKKLLKMALLATLQKMVNHS